MSQLKAQDEGDARAMGIFGWAFITTGHYGPNFTRHVYSGALEAKKRNHISVV